ncbi:MAG: peptidylprolyl isomerase [Deltaproteobacteria bacterium]|nr:peptidylprolyl isomerase [Deltaproteobacteria bacterium]
MKIARERLGRKGLCAAALLALFALSPGSAPANLVEKIVVVVNGVPHTFSDFRKFASESLSQSVRLDELTAGRVPQELLEEFITNELVQAEVKGTGIRVREEDIDNYIKALREQNKLSPAQFASMLARQGKDRARYRQEVRGQIERDELIRRNVRQRIHVTMQDAKRYYDANPQLYRTELRLRLRHLMLSLSEGASADGEQAVRARTEALRQEILDGGDFAALARTHSEGAGASDGGDIGWVKAEDLPDSLAKAAAALQKGAVSPPVRTNLGYHLVRAEDRQGGVRLGFEAVSEQVRDELYTRTLRERFAKWLKTDLRKKHRVEVKLSEYDFEAQEAERGTVGNLMATTAPPEREKGFWDYVNPLTYIYDEESIPDPSGVSDRKRVKLFGIPLFTTEAGDDEDVPLSEPIEGVAPTPPTSGTNP